MITPCTLKATMIAYISFVTIMWLEMGLSIYQEWNKQNLYEKKALIEILFLRMKVWKNMESSSPVFM